MIELKFKEIKSGICSIGLLSLKHLAQAFNNASAQLPFILRIADLHVGHLLSLCHMQHC